jgi:hypothetical protein
MKKLLIIFPCVLLILACSAFAIDKADDKDWTLDLKTSTLVPKYLGIIKVLKGSAFIGDRELKKGSKVYNNELIHTLEKSFIVMEMIDLTVVTLGPLSDFKVENWAYRTKNDRNAQFNIVKGQLRALVKSKSKDPDQLKIKTSFVSMGIRGTQLMVNALNIDGKEVTQIALLEGSVHIEGDTPATSQDLVPGDHAVIVKTEKGLEHQDRKIKDTELNSYNDYIFPDVVRLLEPAKLEGSKIQAANDVVDNDDSKPVDTKLEPTSNSSKTTKENLKLLNKIHEENRKRK